LRGNKLRSFPADMPFLLAGRSKGTSAGHAAPSRMRHDRRKRSCPGSMHGATVSEKLAGSE
jgi:hypothetical protein